MNPIPLPQLDPTPLPLPFWVLKALLLVTFGLHIFAVNVGVGGSFLCVGLAIRGRRPGGAGHSAIARVVAYALPPAVTFAISLGVAPLLLVQLLYGEPIYTSTILIGGPWVLFIFILMAGYALLYKFTDALKQGRAVIPLGVASALLLLSLGFLWTNNVTLMIAPERWSDVHFAAPHGGTLNLGEPSLFPRFLHLATAMGAIAGLLLAGLSVHVWREDLFDRDLARRVGLSVFAYATLAQTLLGPATLLLQKADVRAALLGGTAVGTTALAIGVFAGIGAMVAAFRGRDPRTGKAGVHLPLGLLVITVCAMVTVRDVVRDVSLARAGFVAAAAPVAVDVVAGVALAVSIVIWIVATRAIFGWVFRRPAGTALAIKGAADGN